MASKKKSSKKISFEASNNSRQLFDFDGKEEDVEIKIDEVEEVTVAQEALMPVEDEFKTPIERYFHCKEEDIVMTEEEEMTWKKRGMLDKDSGGFYG